MILTKVVLTDYGLYRGRNEIDLSCADGRPVVLVGGRNGAGKTTLFEAVRLCLYGAASLGAGRRGGGRGRRGGEKYEEFLARRVHRDGSGRAAEGRASVSVSFRFHHMGRESEYMVTRSWSAEGAGEEGVDERLEVGRRGPRGEEFAPLDAVERPHWQQFIEGIIPRGIMDLFFFDGERVARMAAEEGAGAGAGSEAIRESFGALLGLEAVEQLRADLEVNLARNLTGGGAALRKEFEAAKAEKEENGRSVSGLRERLAQKMTERDAVGARAEALEARMARIGGGFAARREEARAELAAARSEHEAACQRLRDMCAGALPFALVPARLERLRGAILEDQDAQRLRAGRDVLKAGLGRVAARLDAAAFRSGAGLDADGAKRAARLAEEAVGEEMAGGGGGGKDAAEPRMGLSPSQAAGLLRTIGEAGSDAAIEGLAEHAGAAASAAERIAALESSLSRVPRDDEIGPLVSELGRLRVEEGRLKGEADHVEERISSGTALRHHLDSRLREIVSRIYKSEGSERAAELTRRVQGVLDEYAGELRARKVHVLERHLLEAARILLHKRDLVGGVSVDPETFRVSLSRPGGGELRRDDLSEGEKQMMATALLWALARTSGRALPFMIDTPLARLDKSHRDSMVERFLPAASHQVVVLSTDEEIGAKRRARLDPRLARAYLIEYEGGATRCREGYFEPEEEEEIAAV